MAESFWAGAGLTTGATGTNLDTWGKREIPVADPGTLLSMFGMELAKNPKRLWKEQPSLRKVVDFAARNVSSVPLPVYIRVDDTDRERDTTSQAATLFKTPGEFVTGPKLLHDITVDLMLYDRWLVVLIDGELKRIPGHLIKVKEDFLGGVTALGVHTPDGVIDVTSLPFAYDAGWGDDSAAGISGLHTLGPTMDEQSRAIAWRTEQWDKAARVSGVLTHPKTLGKQVRDRLKESWDAYSSTEAGGTPLLEDGVQFVPVKSDSPVDSKDLEGRQLTDAEVASFYHIPPELVGARKGTFSNIAAFRQMLFGPTLGPTLARIESAFNLKIVPALAPEGAYAEFNREAALAGSFAEQSAYMQKTVGGPYMTRAEARAKLNLPYLEGTNALITPMNVTESDMSDPSDTAPEWGDGG